MDNSKLLLSFQDTQALLAPLGQTKKIKYTCVAASQSYIALGANTGGVYCFYRSTFKYIRILANKEGSVSIIRFSPTENTLAVCIGSGYVGLWELNLHEQGVSKRFHVSSLLRDSTVKAMVWDNKSSRLFYGDELGRVGVAYLPKQKIFKKPDEIIFQDKSPVVQMDYHQDLLLISTHTRCLLLKLLTKEFIQVGKKPRDGKFGACFHVRWPDKPPVVSSARPGGRLWEADVEGTVVSTLKLKDLIETGPSATPLFGVGLYPEFRSSIPLQLTTPLNLHHLYILRNSFLIGWVGSALFIFSPASYKLSACCEDFESIGDLYCDGRQLYVLSVDGRSVRVVSLVDVGVCVCELVGLQLPDQALKIIERFPEELCSLLPNNKKLYNAVSMAMTKGKSSSAQLSEDLQKIESAMIELKESHGYQEMTIEEEVIQVSDGVTQEETDGLQTVDLDAYTDHDIDTGDTVDLNTNEQIDSLRQEVDTIDPNEPDLDSTLIAEEIDTNPLDSNSQTSLADTNTDTNTLLINEGDFDTSTSSQVEDSSAATDSTRETSLHVIRSKSKIIPNPEIPTSTSNDSWTPDSTSSSLVSGSSSLPQQHSLDERTNLEQHSSSLDKQVPPVNLQRSDSTTSLPLVRRGSMPDFANRVQKVDYKHSVSLDDDVIAVRVSGGKNKSKKKSRRKKTSNPTAGKGASLEVGEPTPSALSLGHIPEEESLPFPEVGLPATPPSHASSAPTSKSVSPYPSLPSTPPKTHPVTVDTSTPPKTHPVTIEPTRGFNASILFNKVKTLTTQLSEKVDVPQPQKQMKMAVKDLFSSLTGPQTVSHDASERSHDQATTVPLVNSNQSHVFYNSDYITEDCETEIAEFALMSPSSSDQSDGRISAPFSPPPPSSMASTIPPELSAFILVTMETRQQLNDPQTLTSVDETRDKLSQWLRQLEVFTISQSPTDNTGSVFMSMLYQNIDSSSQAIVTELATLCAELEVYSSRDQNDIPTNTGCSLGQFLSFYWPILNSQRIRALLNRVPWTVRRAAWKTLININSINEVEDLNEDSLIKKLTSDDLGLQLPAYLHYLCKTSSDLWVKVCAKSYPHIQPYEVAIVCEINQSEERIESRDAYINYLHQLFNNESQQRILETFTFDPDLLLVSMETLFLSQGLKPSEQYSLVLEALTDVAVAMETKDFYEKALTLCQQYKHLMGVVKLSVAMGDRRKGIQVLLQLGDITYLKKVQSTGVLFIKLEDFHILLELMSAQSGSSDSSCVCWDGVLQLMMTSMSLPLFNELISGCHADSIDKQAREQLHWRLVQLTSLHTQQRAVAHSLLEKIDRYLWSQRPTAVSPHVLVAKNTESQDTPLLLSSPLPLVPPTIEDAGSHWGLRTQLNSSMCMTCRLPLTETISDLHPGLVVLHCGHVYHKLCLPEQACLTCFTRKQRKS